MSADSASHLFSILTATGLSAATHSLSNLCTTDYVRKSLPMHAVNSSTIDPPSVAFSIENNAAASSSDIYADVTPQRHLLLQSQSPVTAYILTRCWLSTKSWRSATSRSGTFLMVKASLPLTQELHPSLVILPTVPLAESDGGFWSFAIEKNAVLLNPTPSSIGQVCMPLDTQPTLSWPGPESGYAESYIMSARENCTHTTKATPTVAMKDDEESQVVPEQVVTMTLRSIAQPQAHRA